MQLSLLLDGWILFIGTHHIAYFRVHSRASSLYFSRSVLYILAISGTSGSSGFGSHSREQIDNRTENRKDQTKQWIIIYKLQKSDIAGRRKDIQKNNKKKQERVMNLIRIYKWKSEWLILSIVYDATEFSATLVILMSN